MDSIDGGSALTLSQEMDVVEVNDWNDRQGLEMVTLPMDTVYRRIAATETYSIIEVLSSLNDYAIGKRFLVV